MKNMEYKSQLDDLTFTISQISHEIRNPVTMINSYLQLIEKEHPEVNSFIFWKETKEDMKYLRELLDNLSTYNNSNTLNITRIHSENFIKSICTSVTAAFSTENYQFSWQNETPLPDIYGDPVKLRQALTNLLRNAFESLPDKGHVRLAAKSCDSDLQITVSDNGCGISPEHMSDLFEPFVTHKKNGTGLGLAITKRIITSHRGQLNVSSEPGKGTFFTIRLPMIQENSK